MNSVSIEDFASRLVDDIYEEIVGEVFYIATEALKEAIASTVYSGGGKMYQNTYQLLSAVEVSDLEMSSGTAEFEVRIDSGRLNHVPYRPHWPAYGSMGTTGWNDDDGIIHTLDQGSDGSPFYNHPAHNFFKQAEANMDGQLVSAMARGLASRGYEVTFV